MLKSDLIDNYLIALNEYLNAMNSSEIIQEMEKKDACIHAGLQSITHIFKLTYLSTHNSDIALYYTQKGMYCYLEYIEQMIKTNAFIHLNNMDAIVLEYNRTLMEMYNSKTAATDGMDGSTTISSLANENGERESPSNTDLAKFFASDENVKIDILVETKTVLENLSRWTDLLLYKNKKGFSHPQIIKCAADYFKKYALLFTAENIYLMNVLETVQEKIDMSFEEYGEVLEDFYLQWKKANKQKKIPKREQIDNICLNIILEHSGKTLGDIRKEYGEKHAFDFMKII